VVPAGIADDVSLFENKPGGASRALLTITDVARLLAISVSGVRRLQQGRDIPFIKVRGSVRFFEEDVISYLRRQRVEHIG